MLQTTTMMNKQEKSDAPTSGLMSLDFLEQNNTRISTNTWAVLMLIGYLILGLLFYCYSEEHLSALDAIYLSVITFTTVGYGKNHSFPFFLPSLLYDKRHYLFFTGDIPIKNRVFTAFYVVLGAGIVGSFFGLFSTDVMETHEELMQQKLIGAAKRIDDLMQTTATKVNTYREKKLRELLE